MIDHLTFGVTDFDRSTAFYDATLAPLGLTRLVNFSDDGVSVAAYGFDQPFLWLAGERPVSGLMHFALTAKTRADVDAFHAAAIEAGGTDNGAPGLRPQYHPDYYAAFIHDPDGHNIEAVCHAPTGSTSAKQGV